jgi:hypothetical protein
MGAVFEASRNARLTVVLTSGPDLKRGTDNGLERAAWLVDMAKAGTAPPSAAQSKMGRYPCVGACRSFRASLDRREARGLLPFVRDRYGIG